MSRKQRRSFKARQNRYKRKVMNRDAAKAQIEEIIALQDAGYKFISHGGSQVYVEGKVFQKLHYDMAQRLKQIRKGQQYASNVS